jgi:hypothetical protein
LVNQQEFQSGCELAPASPSFSKECQANAGPPGGEQQRSADDNSGYLQKESTSPRVWIEGEEHQSDHCLHKIIG